MYARLLSLSFLLAFAPPLLAQTADEASTAIREAIGAEQFDEAIATAQRALEAHPDQKKALTLLKASAHQRRGVERFFIGEMAGSVKDFDIYLASFPDEEPHHWQRGLSHYYAGLFAKGVEQFDKHQIVNGTDVENAVWHLACMVKNGLTLEQARAKMYPFAGDRRVPMKEVHGLFKGTAKPEEVLAAAKAGDPGERELQNRLCYAYLYLGLYEEVLGNAEKSMEHMKLGAVTHRMDHYMGKTAQIHFKLRSKPAAEATP